MSAAQDKPAPRPTPAAAAPPPPKKPHLRHDGLRLREAVTVTYSITLPPETPLEAVLDREYWMHVGAKLRPGTFIDVHAEDMSYYAKLYVLSAHRTGAQVKILQRFDLVSEDERAALDAQTTITVKFMGNDKKFCLMAGKQVVQSGFATADDAYRAVAEHARTFAA